MRPRSQPQRGERRVIFKKQAELPFVLMFYHAPNLRSPDSFALDVLSVVLASGRSSRLYRDLVYEKRLARKVDTGLQHGLDRSRRFQRHGPGDARPHTRRSRKGNRWQPWNRSNRSRSPSASFQKAKNQIESSFIFAQDSIFGQATKIGYYEAAGGWKQMDEYIPGIRQVTREDIRRVAASVSRPRSQNRGRIDSDER